MRKQSYSCGLSSGSSVGEPLILVEETTIGEEEAERGENESPPRSVDPDVPSLNPYLLSPWRDARKHSLPTPQCTSGITASQVRRLSERGGEGSGPSPGQAAYLATLSQAPAPQPGGRRHSVVTISKVPPTLFSRDRRESIAAFPLGGAGRILPGRRDSASGISASSSNTGSMHNLHLDIMDNIAGLKARKVRVKMYKTPSQENVCEVEPLEGTSSTQRYTQYQKRRFSEMPTSSVSPTASLRRRRSEIPRAGSSGAAGIVCSNIDLNSILRSLTSSASEINRCGDEASTSREDSKGSWSSKSGDQKRSKLKSFRSNSFDVSILHGTKSKQLLGSSKNSTTSFMAPSNWFATRHEPMSKKQKPDALLPASINFKFDRLKVVKAVKDTLTRTSPTPDAKHKVIWDGTSGTKVDPQVLGTAIEKILTAQRGEPDASGSSSKTSVPTNKPKSSKVASWFSGGNKEQEQAEACEASICTSLKDLFVK